MINSDENSNMYDSKFSPTDKIWVLLRGIPFRATDDQIYDFFAGYDYLDGSLIIGVRPDGKRTGMAVLLFLTEDDAQKAIDGKNGGSMDIRWIELYLKDFSYYSGFYEEGMKLKENSVATLLKDKETRRKAVKLRGLPFTTTKPQIREFMDGFSVKDENVHFELKDGRPTGRAVVFLEDEDLAAQAAKELHREFIGSRYIEVEAWKDLDIIY